MNKSVSTYAIENNKFWEELIAYFPWWDTDRIENGAYNSYTVACVFVTAVNLYRAVA
jgi:hypothetical protein